MPKLQYALNSRVIIEQAKGAVAQKLDLSTGEAFNALRRYSRAHNQRLVDTATALVDRTLDAAALTAKTRGPAGRSPR